MMKGWETIWTRREKKARVSILRRQIKEDSNVNIPFSPICNRKQLLDKLVKSCAFNRMKENDNQTDMVLV